MPCEPEIIVARSAPRESVSPISSFRGAPLVSSLQAVRDERLFDRYLTLLPVQHHETVRGMAARVWWPVELGIVHYEACDALGLSTAEQINIGRSGGRKVQGTFLETITRMAKGAGITPWSILSQYQKLWDRVMVGGGVRVTKRGPKDATIEFVNIQFASIPYCRAAFRGLNVGACEFCCRKAYAEEVLSMTTPTSFGVRISWV